MLFYYELYQYDTLEHLLHVSNSSVIITYHQKDNYGHYCKQVWENPLEDFIVFRSDPLR